MLQEDSNGESTFEIIDRKNREIEKTDSTGNLIPVSSGYSNQVTSTMNPPSGNLLSNVKPPSTLPDFMLWSSPAGVAPNIKSDVHFSPSPQIVPAQSQPTVMSLPTKSNIIPSAPHSASLQTQQAGISSLQTSQPMLAENQFPTTEFSAAIPPSKGIQHDPALHKYNEDDNSSGGFLGLVKGAFSSGVLFKMAEKAKNSVDSIITTLDPQMSEYIYSSGDIEVTVTSKNEEEVSAIREAFHSVLGKAWVNGVDLNLPQKKSQAIGFEKGIKNAEEKIEYSLKYRKTPTVAIENILLQQDKDWFDLSILILKDTERQITIQTLSQATPVPVDKYLKKIENERPDCSSMSVEEKLALYLHSRPNWQAEISEVTRKDVLALAGKTLVSIYKKQL